tara:strand:- start:1007 stop:2119 length:1113 start_codon:yes stop_codon:yes gene_type:complete
MGGSSKSMLLPFNMPPVAKGGMLGFLSSGGGGVSGVWWKEIGRQTLTGSADTLEVTGLDTYPYLMVFAFVNVTGGDSDCTWTGGNDGGYLGDYAERRQENGGSSASTTNRSSNGIIFDDGSSQPYFVTGFISNIDDEEKFCVWQTVMSSSAGAGTAPDRCNTFGKLSNSAQLTRLKLNVGRLAGTAAAGSQIIIAGYDPSSPDGNNLWTQLGTAEVTGSASATLDITTLSSLKDYLMIEVFIPSGSAHHGFLYFNNDDNASNENYCRRGNAQANGSDFTTAPDNEINFTHDTNHNKYWTSFWLNKQSAVKKGVSTYTDTNTTKTMQICFKWDNTSNQIGDVASGYAIRLSKSTSSADFPVGTKMTCWGFS